MPLTPCVQPKYPLLPLGQERVHVSSREYGKFQQHVNSFALLVRADMNAAPGLLATVDILAKKHAVNIVVSRQFGLPRLLDTWMT